MALTPIPSILDTAKFEHLALSALYQIASGSGGGTSSNVTIVGSLPAGTNAIGTVNPDSSGGTGTLSASANTYTITTTNYSTLSFQAVKSGTINAGSITIYGSVDGTTFSVLTTYVSLTTGGASTTFAATNSITVGQINTVGLKAVQFSGGSTITGGGSLLFTVNQSASVSNVMLDNPLPTGTNVIGAVTSNNSEIRVQSSFTRPANTTAYVSGYLVANSTTSGSVVALSFASVARNAGDCVRIERARINTSNALLTNASFRLHLFEGTPVPSVGDGAAFNSSGVLSTSGIAGYLGSFSITLSNSGSDGSNGRGIPDTGSAITASPTSGTTIYGLLEATAAYVPTSASTITVTLEGYRP